MSLSYPTIDDYPGPDLGTNSDASEESSCKHYSYVCTKESKSISIEESLKNSIPNGILSISSVVPGHITYVKGGLAKYPYVAETPN